MTYMLKDDRRKTRANTQGAPADIVDLRFRKLLGAQKWDALPRAVQARFGKSIQGQDICVYKGRIIYTRMNRAGYMLAQILRLVGAPLPLDRDEGGAPAIVTVTQDAAGQGQFWSRQYGRIAKDKKTKFPQIIQSTKRFAGPLGLEEYIGYGIGMTLRLDVKDAVLRFHSDRYFVQFFGRRIYLPRRLCPGALTVGHEDKGAGKFHFTLTLQHPVFGILLDQCAEFADD